ncbi:MAG: hypothetical protein AAF998_29560 [Bacteroidota bacterium]
MKTSNVRHLARYSSPGTLPGPDHTVLERQLDALWGSNSELNTENSVRISNHLTYVSQLLSLRSTQHLNEARRNNRTHLLHFLGRYAERGIFPSGYEQNASGRLCHKDEAGRRCAIGHLIEKTSGPNLADRICGTHLDLMDGHTRLALEAWMDQNGITAEELALIQPGFRPGGNHRSAPGISAAFTGLQAASRRSREIQPRENAFAALVRHKSPSVPPAPVCFTTIFDLFKAQSGSNPLQVMLISNKWGEPALAMTFSRNL